MKKNYFILLIACLFVVKGFAQQVEQQQRSLITKRTADWCQFCGTWGWTYFVNAIEQNGNKAVYMAAHYDGGLSDPAANEITDNFGGFSQPKFFLNEVAQGVTSGNVTAKLTALKTAVDAAFAQAPVANSGFNPFYANGEIKVAAKVKFFQATQGDFYLGLYLLEDNVVANQASIGANAVHKRLFRHSFTNETFGQPITNGDVAAGQEFNLDFALATENPAEHEYEVVGVIWKKDGDKYIPVNTWSTTTFQTASNTTQVVPVNKLTLAPNIATDIVNIYTEITENQPVAKIEVLDINGRVISTIHDGPINNHQSSFQFSSKKIGGTGLHFVRLTTPGFTLVEKVVFQ